MTMIAAGASGAAVAAGGATSALAHGAETPSDAADRLYRQYVDLIPEMRACGTDNRADDANYEKRVVLEEAIDSLLPTANSTAALILIGISVEATDADADVLPVPKLQNLQSHTTGLIREHLDTWFTKLADNKATKLAEMPPFFDFGYGAAPELELSEGRHHG